MHRNRLYMQGQKGFSTLVMMIALGIALSAALYGTYSRVQATGKLQNETVDRDGARAIANNGVDAVASYLNTLYCGGAYAPCAAGNTATLSGIAAGTQLLATSVANGTSSPNYLQATVLNNSFGTNGYIEVKITGNQGDASSTIDSFYGASTLYTYTPLQYAFLINGNQNLTGNVTINTGSSALTVNGNLSIGGSATVTAAQATGSISGTCTDGSSSCVSGVTTPFTSPSVDAYTLTGEANAILALDVNGNPQVTFQNNPALPSGTYPLSSPTALAALCQGGVACISYSGGTWSMLTQPAPGVLFFYGDLSVASGADGSNSSSTVGYNGLIVTGNTTIATNNNITAYGQMPNVCQTAPVPSNICLNGAGTAPNGPVANLVVLSGGTITYPYAGATSPPAVGSMTASTPSLPTLPSGTVTGYECSSSSSSMGTSGSCPSGSTTTGLITGGNIVLQGNSNLKGVVAAGESLTARGTGTITGMIDTADTNNLSSSTLGDNTSVDNLNGNLTINYDPGVGTSTNLGGGGTPMKAFRSHWQRYL